MNVDLNVDSKEKMSTKKGVRYHDMFYEYIAAFISVTSIKALI